MQTRSATRRAANARGAPATASPSDANGRALATGEAQLFEIHISQTRSDTGGVVENMSPKESRDPGNPTSDPQPRAVPGLNTKGALKRATDISNTMSLEKKAKRTRGMKARPVKTTLPADVLPHGLGRIHGSRTDGIIDNGDRLATLANKFAVQELGAKDVQVMLPFLSQFVQGMIEEAVRSEATPRGKYTAQPRQTHSSTSLPRSIHDEHLAAGDVQSAKIIEAKRVPRKTKDNPYGLMPGRTPFPDWTGPTPEMCAEVHRLLTDLHGEFKAPDKIPAPSTSVAGCGEVPDLVDAMIRTLVSGHTTMANANHAIQDIIIKYGQWPEDSIGAGSIDWNKVRLSDVSEIVEAVRRAGLGRTKGNDIKLILEQVFQENQQRKSAYLEEKNNGEKCTMSGCSELSQGQKDHQLLKIENGVLTLDHVRGLTPEDAMLEFTRYPGIGVKTASCLILFCLQQPSFAVDTHVWRFCKWLKWVPPKANRDDTYMHGEVRIPDKLKYGLHQLFIRHGKECGRCRGGTVEGTAEWESVVCPLEHLLDRFDKRKAKIRAKSKQEGETKKKRGGASDDLTYDEHDD